MLGVGLSPKVRWLLLVTTFLLVLIWRVSFVEAMCLNIDLLRLRTGEEAWCAWVPDGHEVDMETGRARLIWLQGYNLWSAGNFNQAMTIWEQSPQYAAKMLTMWAQNDRLAEVCEQEIPLTQALLLDPNSFEISESISFQLFESQQWETAYDVFTTVTEIAPENAVAQAALALAGSRVGQSEIEMLKLIDIAVAEAPDNLYVLRYGLRLMQRMPTFGIERTKQLATLGVEQLPQDFEFTFGIANAYLNLGDLEKSTHYNLMALDINPIHPWANLQYIELIQQRGEIKNFEPWLEHAISYRVKERPDYYQRLLTVLIKIERFSEARTIFCDGLANGIKPDVLTSSLEGDVRLHIEKAQCSSLK